MKNIYKITMIVLTAFLVFACESEDDKVIAQAVNTVSLTDKDMTVELTENNANDSITISWEKSSYGIETLINYTLEVGLSGTDFVSPVFIGKTTENSYKLTLGELNSFVLQAGLSKDIEGTVEIRVKSSLGSQDSEELISETIKLTTTPYFVLIVLQNRLWLPGSYANASGYGNDWDPADPNTPTIAALEAEDTDYEGYIYFANDDSKLKIIEGPEWGAFTDYGIDGTNEGKLSDGGAESDLPVATSGYYRVNVDLDALTYSFTDTDWAVTGSSTPKGFAPPEAGPDQDHDLVYDPDAKTWSTTLDLTVGELKFRANDSWDINYGGALGILSTEGDNNIPVNVAGNYTIVLDFSNPRIYTYSLIKN